jgi:hypothetical protein
MLHVLAAALTIAGLFSAAARDWFAAPQQPRHQPPAPPGPPVVPGPGHLGQPGQTSQPGRAEDKPPVW